MTPTKNFSNLAQTAVKKNVRKAAKPMKPPLKTPSCITVKIPNIIALKQLGKSSDTPDIMFSQVTAEAKVAQLTTEQVNTGVKIKATPTRTRKSTTKLTSEELGSDNTPLEKKVVLTFPSVPNKPKRKSKLSLKALEIKDSSAPSNSPTKPKSDNDAETNEEGRMQESFQRSIKKPGSKNKTMNTPLTKKKPVEKLETSLEFRLLDIKKKIVKPLSVTKGKARPGKKQQKVISDFFSDGAVKETDDKAEVISKPPVKRAYKRKQTPKKQENDPKDTEETAAKKARGKPRAKFVNERLTNNSKVTRSSNKESSKWSEHLAVDLLGVILSLSNAYLDYSGTNRQHVNQNSIISLVR